MPDDRTLPKLQNCQCFHPKTLTKQRRGAEIVILDRKAALGAVGQRGKQASDSGSGRKTGLGLRIRAENMPRHSLQAGSGKKFADGAKSG